jgi:hypothetical protein
VSIVLGFQPERLTVKLSRFSDFVSALEYDDGDPDTPNEWPPDAVLALRFYATETSTTVEAEWPATFAGALASWHQPKAQCAALLDDGHDQARLFYSRGGVELEWAVGPTKDTN